MKKILLLAMGLALCASAVSAQPGGALNPYWDAGGTQCYAQGVSGLCYTYFYHEGIPKANASQFVMTVDPGFIATYVAFSTAPYLNILSGGGGFPNDPRGGISIAYGNPLCEPLPALIMTVTWVCTGAEANCSFVRVTNDPLDTIPGIETRNCSNKAVPAAGGTLYVGATDSCGACSDYISTSEQSWGQIKALYQ